MKPKIEECLPSNVDYSEFQKLPNLFTDPTAYDAYETSLKVAQSWSYITERTQISVQHVREGQCANAGNLFGKLIRDVIGQEASLTTLANQSYEYTMATASSLKNRLSKMMFRSDEL